MTCNDEKLQLALTFIPLRVFLGLCIASSPVCGCLKGVQDKSIHGLKLISMETHLLGFLQEFFHCAVALTYCSLFDLEFQLRKETNKLGARTAICMVELCRTFFILFFNSRSSASSGCDDSGSDAGDREREEEREGVRRYLCCFLCLEDFFLGERERDADCFLLPRLLLLLWCLLSRPPFSDPPI